MELLGPAIGPLRSHIVVDSLKRQFRPTSLEPNFRPIRIGVDGTSEQVAVEQGQRRRIRTADDHGSQFISGPVAHDRTVSVSLNREPDGEGAGKAGGGHSGEQRQATSTEELSQPEWASTIEEGAMDGNVVSTERVIRADPDAIFGLLADASRHPDIDGSGTVKKVKTDAPARLTLGATFGMSMKAGIGYSMVNTVVEFEDNRRIAWQARPPGFLGRIAAGRIWRYELEPVENGTRVRESWDLTEDHQRRMLKLGGLPQKTEANMAKTLQRIAELTETPA